MGGVGGAGAGNKARWCLETDYWEILKPCQEAGCGNLVVLLTGRNLKDRGEDLSAGHFVMKRQRDQVEGP